MNLIPTWLRHSLSGLNGPDDGSPVFIEQVLAPTGGWIRRPRDWHYSEAHRQYSLVWTLSKEDTEQGRKGYVTGMSIQLLLGVESGTGATREQFALDYFEKTIARADHVICRWPRNLLANFMRTGVELEAADMRIRYSVFWCTGRFDAVVVAIAGTRRELWAEHEGMFDAMADFQLIAADFAQ